VCQSHTGRLTGFWFLLNRPKGWILMNEWIIPYKVWFYHKDDHTCCDLLGSITVYSGLITYFVLGQFHSLFPSQFSRECELVLWFQVPVPSCIVKDNGRLLPSPSSSVSLFYLSFCNMFLKTVRNKICIRSIYPFISRIFLSSSTRCNFFCGTISQIGPKPHYFWGL